METKKRILILTADAGFGHRSAANAICEALEEKYPERVSV
jgi:ATP-dependent Lon protease